MEIKQVFPKMKGIFTKYKFVALILLVGIGLMLIPTSSEDEVPKVESETVQDAECLEETLSKLLSKVHGAGKVDVMLNIDQGSKTIYQMNIDVRDDGSDYSDRSETVTVTDGQRNEHGLIQQVNPPVYLGAIVLCQGADNPVTKLSIVEAVSKITGLKASQICVLKMD